MSGAYISVKINRKRKVMLEDEDEDEDEDIQSSTKQRKSVQQSSSPVESKSASYSAVFKK